MLHKTVRHKDATIFHCGHCVSLSISNVLTQSFSVLKVFAENVQRYLTNEYSYRADFTDLDTVYQLGKTLHTIVHFKRLGSRHIHKEIDIS